MYRNIFTFIYLLKSRYDKYVLKTEEEKKRFCNFLVYAFFCFLSILCLICIVYSKNLLIFKF